MLKKDFLEIPTMMFVFVMTVMCRSRVVLIFNSYDPYVQATRRFLMRVMRRNGIVLIAAHLIYFFLLWITSRE